MNSYQPQIDLGGEVCFRPNCWQTRHRINHLIAFYLSDRALCDRLEDLPQQFVSSQPRPWQPLVLQRMRQWSHTLTPEYLQSQCATPDFFGHNNLESTNNF